MLLYRTPRNVTSTNMRKTMYVVTPRCASAAAAVVSAVAPRRPTKEYTHPYSMMHRRLHTAGIEVAPHYHQLLVLYRECDHENTQSTHIHTNTYAPGMNDTKTRKLLRAPIKSLEAAHSLVMFRRNKKNMS